MYIRGLSIPFFYATLVSAGYFSSGWSPDSTSTAQTPLETIGEAVQSNTPSFSGFDFSQLLTSGPIAKLAALGGINITEKLEAAKKSQEVGYDVRIPLITDANYDEVKDELEEEETHFIVVTLPNDPISKLVDTAYDEAYDHSLKHRDLPNIKWGRVDYMNVTRVTTEWWVWKAPVLVIAQDHFTKLRFLYPRQVSLDAVKMHKFLKNAEWEEVPVWEGSFAPGGTFQPYVKSYAKWYEGVYAYISMIPKWLFLIGSGAAASAIIGFMHSWSDKPEKASPAIETTSAKDGKSTTKATRSGVSTRSTAPKAGAIQPAATIEEMTSTLNGGVESGDERRRSKRYVVKKATEVHPELSNSKLGDSMTGSKMGDSWAKLGDSMLSEGTSGAASGVSESEGGSRPAAARRRSSRKPVKK